MYSLQSKGSLSNYVKITDNIYSSIFNGLSLSDYINARQSFCNSHHKLPCANCEKNGWVCLADGFKDAFPNVTYTAHTARRRLLQMPLVCIKIETSQGREKCFLLEKHDGVDFNTFFSLFKSIFSTLSTSASSTKLSKGDLQSLLSVCTSDKERCTLRYVAYKASGLSASQARKHFGFQNISQLENEVKNNMLDKCLRIRQSIENLANIRERSVCSPN